VSKFPSHLVVSNFNTDPTDVLVHATSYTIYDQSTDPAIAKLVAEKFPSSIRAHNSGHNISDYLRFVSDHWEDLSPDGSTALVKGNIIGRHVTREFFDRSMLKSNYTFLYQDPSVGLRQGISSLLFESSFLEKNNSWFADSKRHRYFATTNELINFLYLEPVFPDWLNFAPGACYIVPNSMLLALPRSLFSILHEVVTYCYFPSEAYMVERLLHMILNSPGTLHPYLYDVNHGLEALESRPDRSGARLPGPTWRRRLANHLGFRG
jgi:hypothetical protein